MEEKVAYQRPKELQCPYGDSARCFVFDRGLKAMAKWIQDRTMPAHADAGYTYESFEVLGVCAESDEWVNLLDELGLEESK